MSVSATDNFLQLRTLSEKTKASLNCVLRTINVDTCLANTRFTDSQSFIILGRTNQFRSRLLAIQKARPIAYRAKVLGRALLAARTDANIFWILLSGNVEVAFPSRTTTIAAAANLPTPTTGAATSTANVAAVAASVMSALATTATRCLSLAAAATAAIAVIPSTAAVANVATPSAGQCCECCYIF
jgi:hypothetical protein